MGSGLAFSCVSFGARFGVFLVFFYASCFMLILSRLCVIGFCVYVNRRDRSLLSILFKYGVQLRCLSLLDRASYVFYYIDFLLFIPLTSPLFYPTLPFHFLYFSFSSFCSSSLYSSSSFTSSFHSSKISLRL